MTKTFTYDDVVRYIYSETTADENAKIVEALALSDDLMDFYLDSLEIRQQMNRIDLIPSDRVLNEILNYSQLASSGTAIVND